MKGSIIILFVAGILFSSCKNDKRIPQEVLEKEVNLQVTRFEREFAESTPDNLSDLKEKYPYLFPEQYVDSVWITKQQDSIQKELYDEVTAVFPDFNKETESLELLYKHVLYYFPQHEVPSVITLISDVDYQNRIILADTLLLIGLDNYLGSDHRFYAGIDRYLASGLQKKYMVSDVASAFCKSILVFPRDRTFLAQMIYYGKELYVKDRILPLESNAVKIGYTEEELFWAEANEEQIWRNFIEKEYLYSTDTKLSARFLDPAPFSKFGLVEIDKESPGRIGRYMGWQIVNSFMDNNDIDLLQLLSLPADEIFKRSKYKPRK